VDAAHHAGAGHVEDLVAALQAGEVVERELVPLQRRAHHPVRHDDTGGERGQQR